MRSQIQVLSAAALFVTGVLLSTQARAAGHCDQAVKVAAAGAAKSHQEEEGARIFVQVSEPVKLPEMSDIGTDAYRVATQLSAQEPINYVVTVNRRTCQAVSIVMEN